MADELKIVVAEDGSPALLSGPVQIDPNASSGNPAHEVATGRFGSDGKKPTPPGRRKVAPPEQTTNGPDVHRRRDAVVDAARTLTDLTPDGVRQFVRQRWRGDKPLQETDVQSFSQDAQLQRIADVVDALDYRLRKSVNGRGGSKIVKVEFPRGQLKGNLGQLDANQVITVLDRLRTRGWTEEQIQKHVIKPFQLSDNQQANPPVQG